MLLAQIQGKVTATAKHDTLEGQRLLIAQEIGPEGAITGEPMIIIDQLGARQGDQVIISSDGKGMRALLGHNNSPARWFTVGIANENLSPNTGGRE